MEKYLRKYIKPGILFLGCFLYFGTVKAQYVTIPDTAFVAWLDSNGFSQCLDSNQLDTTCTAVTNAVALYCYAVPIHDLTGIQYFKSLDTLDCSNDSLYLLPPQSASLKYLNCRYNNLTVLPPLSDSLQYLDCSWNQLDSLPLLPDSLTYLDCSWNFLDTLLPLPPALISLYCGGNQLSILPALPVLLQQLNCTTMTGLGSLPLLPLSLLDLTCSNDGLTGLPSLPAGLISLDCNFNQINSLPALPATLNFLNCSANQLTNLALPASLTYLDCSLNPLGSLPVLPPTLRFLNCWKDQLTSLPALPDTLQELWCMSNQLDSLPALPATLHYLNCAHNLLTSLPYNSLNIPATHPFDTQVAIDCSFNQLTYIPNLPPYLYNFYCNSNPNLNCLPPIGQIVNLDFDSTGITCLPNYGTVLFSMPALDTVPLCDANNMNGCSTYWNISGQAFTDANNNCVHDAGESVYRNIKVNLFQQGVLLQQAFTNSGGYYSFHTDSFGIYQVGIDTTNLPFNITCPLSNLRTDTVTASDSMQNHQGFSLVCPPGFDVGAWSVWSRFKPGNNSLVHIVAGDISNLFAASCAAAVSGSVMVTLSGPVTYVSPAPGAVTPFIAGDTIVWGVTDFDTINPLRDFNIILNTSYNAHGGDEVCITVSVLPTTGDNNPANNTLTHCFTVRDALDPNYKEVSPAGNIDSSQTWLTYTIEFQNTGTAEANNIMIADTLDAAHLDLSSIQLLDCSYPATVRVLKNGVVQFYFAYINLPDSTDNLAGSVGYVQFKIKLLRGLPVGTEVNNTGYIYFDYNSAVTTNTASSVISTTAGIVTVKGNSGTLDLSLFPNPAKDYVMVTTGQNAIGGVLQLTDITGREVVHLSIAESRFQIPTTVLLSGVYFVKVTDPEQRTTVKRLVVE